MQAPKSLRLRENRESLLKVHLHRGVLRLVVLCRRRRMLARQGDTPAYHHLFTLSARSYTIPRNFCDAFYTPVAINLIRFRDFGERLIGEDARGSSSKGLLVYPPLVLAATVCGYDGLGMWQGPCNSFCLPLQHAQGMAAAGTSGKRLDVQDVVAEKA